jgi:hypothetical protein
MRPARIATASELLLRRARVHQCGAYAAAHYDQCAAHCDECAVLDAVASRGSQWQRAQRLLWWPPLLQLLRGPAPPVARNLAPLQGQAAKASFDAKRLRSLRISGFRGSRASFATKIISYEHGLNIRDGRALYPITIALLGGSKTRFPSRIKPPDDLGHGPRSFGKEEGNAEAIALVGEGTGHAFCAPAQIRHPLAEEPWASRSVDLGIGAAKCSGERGYQPWSRSKPIYRRDLRPLRFASSRW